MFARNNLRAAAVALLVLSVPLAVAEIVSVAGSVSASIQAFDSAGVTEEQTNNATLPDGEQTFPLRAISRLIAEEQAAAGAVAAQLADPLTASGPNPQDFAFSMTLNSLSPTIYYAGTASAEEVRTIRLDFGDVGLLPVGARVNLRGRLYLDGALAIFAVPEAEDLSGAELRLHVTILRLADDEQPQTVVDGELHITGGPTQEVTVTASGDFPTRGVFDANLAALDPELGVFRVVTFPALLIEYPYTAIIGREVELRARIEVQAANRPGGVGVAAILGTPLDTLPDIIELTRDEAAAKRMAGAIQRQRATPSGTPLESPARVQPTPLPLCGALGFEFVLGTCMFVSVWGRRMMAQRRPW